MVNLYVALVHYPVVNKQGDIIAAAVTNLDLHDIARSACTYGARAFYVVTPLTDQMRMIEKIVSHWTTGGGGRYNPARREALSLIRIESSLSDVLEDIRAKEGINAEIVVTSAKKRAGSLGYQRFKEMIHDGRPYLMVLGTAWGLSETVMETADHVLAPVSGPADYNHLSVRSAAAIILDRLVGC
ncbi:MAG: RNA methyltransferase [Desulfobacterales bacterium]|jgi:hypothetical protein|nr:RNA methyltransferase [Desulfobacterales bacterium]